MAEQAERILRRVRAAYAVCNRYTDSGLLEELGQDREIRRRASFRTTFTRPGQFEFAFEDIIAPTTLIKCSLHWSDGIVTLSHDAAEAERAESLGLAVARLTGITAGVAHTVAALLFPAEVGGWNVTHLRSPECLAACRLGELVVDRVQGLHPANRMPVTLFVGKAVPFLHRVVETLVVDTGPWESIISYEPRGV